MTKASGRPAASQESRCLASCWLVGAGRTEIEHDRLSLVGEGGKNGVAFAPLHVGGRTLRFREFGHIERGFDPAPISLEKFALRPVAQTPDGDQPHQRK